MVTIADSDNESDSLLPAQSLAPLAARETVDEEDIKKDQADHKFDFSTLFNLAPRDGKGAGSGFGDAGSLNTFATGISHLTQTIGTLADPTFQANEHAEESAELPVNSIPNSTTPTASNISEITSESNPGSLLESVSVASAPSGLRSRSSSPTNSTRSLSGDE